MESAKLNINTEWLVWARKTSHYKINDIAKKMKKDEGFVEELEKTGEIEYNTLLELSKHYQRPTSVFFSKGSPKYEETIPDFRTLASETKKEISPKIALEIRNAKYKRQTLLNIETESNEFKLPKFKFNNLNNASDKEISEVLMDELEGNRANLSILKLKNWITKIESLGVLVFEFYGINPEELRGYALYYDKLPIIGINHREYDNPKKFTLFHELAHLLVKKEGISNLKEYNLEKKEEIRCNKIAAEFIVPTKLFKQIITEKRIKNFDKENIRILSKTFKISKDVIIRKALDLKLIDNTEYKNKQNDFNSYLDERKKQTTTNKSLNEKTDKTDETKESKKLSTEEKYKRQASEAQTRNGNYYIKKLFEAYDKDLISDLDVSIDLDVSLNVVRKLQENISIEEYNDEY
jgi:Zn-dependent peptidase ImmA (M78 family)